jgi:anti-anti-sigma factor
MAFPLASLSRKEETRPAPAVIHFTGGKVALDEETLHGIRDQLFALADEPSPSDLFLDFGNVEFVASMALGLLVGLHKDLLSRGRRLTLINLSPSVHEVFAVTKLDHLLDLRMTDESAATRESDPDGSPATILVVDDEEMVRATLAAWLRNWGFAVRMAAHGPQAIELYRRHQPEIAVVLLDVRMPGMDGPQTLSALRKICPAVRCCFMTGNPAPYTGESLLRMGAIQVFCKPFAFAEVLGTLDRLASQSPRRQDHWLEIPLQRRGHDVGA